MLEYLLSLSLLIVVVLLIRGIFRKTVSPRAIYALWLVVVIRMLLPISLFEVDVTLPKFMQTQQIVQEEQPEQLPEDSEISADVQEQAPVSTPMQTTPTIPSQSTSPTTPEYSTVITPSTPATDPEEVITPEEPTPEVPEEPVSVNWKRIADLVWFSGAVIASVWVLLTSITYFRRLKKDRVFHRTVRGTKVYVSEYAGVPCIAGLIPSIYITPEAANSKSEILIIIHEHVHLRHGDHIWSIIRALALIVFWWNPLVWLAATVSKQDAELACDDAISSRMNDDGRLKYANILIDTIPQKHRYAVGLGSAPMKERILMLTKKQKNRWISLILAIVLAVSAVGCSFVSLNEKVEEVDPSVSDTTTSTDEQSSPDDTSKENFPFKDAIPTINVDINELKDKMEQFEDSGQFPATAYNINLDGLTVPVVLTMHTDYVAAIEAHGQYVRLYRGFDIYGNCSFELFEADGAVIIEGGYYGIGDVYVLSPDGHSEIRRGEKASYWIWKDGDGKLKYYLKNNKTANITQEGPMSVITSRDELLYAIGKASITDGNLVFESPDESYTMSDKYDLDKEFEVYGKKYANIEELFAANIEKEENYNSRISYTRHGIAVALTDLYYNDLTYVTPVYTTPQNELGENDIAEFTQKAMLGTGGGWLFSIVRHEENDLLSAQTNHGNFQYFAHDDTYWYGIMSPTDVQLDLSSESLREEYRMLYEEKDEIVRAILAANQHLTPASNEDAYKRYSEIHLTTHGPFIGYVGSKETPWIGLYTEINGTYVGRIPYEIFHDWVATDRNREGWTPGWQPEYVHFYYAEFGDFRWAAAHLTDTTMGNGRKNVATSADGGKTWDVGSTMDDYGGNHVVGMYFVSDKIAFMSFDPNNVHELIDGPEISRTIDGGKTWKRLVVSVPDSLKGKKLLAGTPIHEGDVIRYPIRHNPAHGSFEGETMYIISRDNGMTWEWENQSALYPTDEEIISEYEKATKIDDIFALAISELVGNVDTSVDKPIKIGDIHYFESKKYLSFDEFRNELLTVFSEEITDEMLDTELIKNVDGKLYAALADGGDSAPISYRNDIAIIPISENKLTLRVTVKITDGYLRTYGYYASGQIIDTVNVDFTYEKIGNNWVFTEFPYIRGVFDSKLREKYTEYEFDFGKLVLPSKYDGQFIFKTDEGKYSLTSAYDPHGNGQYSDDQVFKIWRIPLGEEIPKKDGLTVTNAIGYDDKYVYIMTSGVSTSRSVTYESGFDDAVCESVTAIVTYTPHVNGWQYFGVLEHLIPIEQNTIHQSILENKATVYNPDSKSDVLLSDYLKSSDMDISKYIVLDLDESGAHETILWLEKGENEYLGFLILCSKGEKSYAHLLYYRQFADLKTDGTFNFSSGVSNHGIGRLYFAGDTCTIDKIAYCESSDNQNISYFIENKSVSKETFDAYTAIHSQKPSVSWYDYTYGT